MKYGYFDDEKREYVITNPKTPVKWTNYVGTLAFGGIVDHTGGSLMCKKRSGTEPDYEVYSAVAQFAVQGRGVIHSDQRGGWV